MDDSLKEIINEIGGLEGHVRGDVVLGTISCIKQKKGEEGLNSLIEKMNELGYDINLEKLKPLDWYPESLSVILILVAKDLFEWQDKDIYDLGSSVPKYSFIMKILIKYFVSLEKILAEAPKYWEKYFDFGKIEVVDSTEGRVVIRIMDYKFHPTICTYQAGYFSQIAQLAIGPKTVVVAENKCMHKNDPYHEYLLTWDK